MRNLGQIRDPKDIVTKEWVEHNHERIVLMSRTYTGVYAVSTSYLYYMAMRFVPKDTSSMWHIKYRVKATVPGQDAYIGEYWCEYFGYGSVVTAYHNFNTVRTYPIYYNSCYYGTASNVLTYGNFFGVYLNGNNYSSASYARTITFEVTFIEGGELTFLEQMKDQRTVTFPLDGVSTTINLGSVGGGATNVNAYGNGLQETGDSDTYSQAYWASVRLPINSSVRIGGYSIVGFDKDGSLIPIGGYGASTYSTNISDVVDNRRWFCEVGFDVSKGLLYCSGSTNFAAGALHTGTKYFYMGNVDLRYMDNVVASQSATPLSLGLRDAKAVYLRGKLKNGLFYLAPMEVEYNGKTYRKCWTQDVPTLYDGYFYWLLGFPYYSASYATNLYAITLPAQNPLYQFKSGRFMEIHPVVPKIEMKFVVDSCIPLIGWKRDHAYVAKLRTSFDGNGYEGFKFIIKARHFEDDPHRPIYIPLELGYEFITKIEDLSVDYNYWGADFTREDGGALSLIDICRVDDEDTRYRLTFNDFAINAMRTCGFQGAWTIFYPVQAGANAIEAAYLYWFEDDEGRFHMASKTIDNIEKTTKPYFGLHNGRVVYTKPAVVLHPTTLSRLRTARMRYLKERLTWSSFGNTFAGCQLYLLKRSKKVRQGKLMVKKRFSRVKGKLKTGTYRAYGVSRHRRYRSQLFTEFYVRTK